jgi:hypothetical protein
MNIGNQQRKGKSREVGRYVCCFLVDSESLQPVDHLSTLNLALSSSSSLVHTHTTTFQNSQSTTQLWPQESIIFSSITDRPVGPEPQRWPHILDSPSIFLLPKAGACESGYVHILESSQLFTASKAQQVDQYWDSSLDMAWAPKPHLAEIPSPWLSSHWLTSQTFSFSKCGYQ